MAVDKVLLAAPRGFCAGVEMAIKALAWMVRAFEPPVYCYHEIVHNQLVVDRFADLGVVFVDDIAEVPPGRPLMLSAHGSAPEVVAAARANGGYVVDAVCPLVTKVHHEVKVRAGKGYQIVYVGHEGHEEAVGTMAVAPDAIHRVESLAEVDALPEFDARRSPCWPRPRSATATGRRARRPRRRALPRPVEPRALRPVLRHHQPPGRPRRDRPALRRRGGHRLGQLLQHRGPREAGPRGRHRPGPPHQRRRTSCPTTSPAPSASPPAPRPPSRWSRSVIAAWPRPTASRRCASPRRTSTSRRPANLRDLLAGRRRRSPPSPSAARSPTAPASDDRSIARQRRPRRPAEPLGTSGRHEHVDQLHRAWTSRPPSSGRSSAPRRRRTRPGWPTGSSHAAVARATSPTASPPTS